MMKRFRAIGPGALTAAAFIGPGTVTTATLAGAGYGYALVWALVFATIAAIILQETAARLGVAGRRGLGEAIMEQFADNRVLRWVSGALIISALFIGNAAYEGGNIAGAVLGVEAAFPEFLSRPLIAGVIALAAGIILLLGGYRIIEKVLIVAVLIMTFAFASALLIIGPDWPELLKGAFVPTIPLGAFPIVLGLIGTTIVPYNLFLHAAAARKRWNNPDDLAEARFDARLSIGVGGVVSILVLSTAAASLFGVGMSISNAADMARQLEPAFGVSATYLMAAGLFAAGLSSAITAPLATGFAAAELFGFDSDPKNRKFRVVSGAVLLIGAIVAMTGARPIEIILFAQIANGVLLPVVAIFLLYAANNKKLLGKYANGLLANAAGVVVTLIAAMLGLRGILRAFGVM
ncbi:Nramp family divalent metal transporter [Hyphococcus flavus]|uniref:Nramp family divalent metal transporter n=1 Tax=Hyphococcus flavus TaxID=1866326 RepID=A0AAE9ZKY7_9PROT|nr:Nramp family divalent metal transporter [Hyphococcus flavus]WDI33051.1 Nramp family divalent metal transporter [Hyphococcus flavus]